MTIARTTVVAAALTALWGAPPARAEDAAGAARRVAGSLAQQLKARPPRTPLSTVAVAPATEPAALQKDGLARLFAELLVPELARAAGVKVRDWKSVDAAAREQALKAAAAGGLDLPSVPEVQALLVTEASGAADGAVRLQVRLVAVPGGAVLASESGKLEPAARATTPSPAGAAAAAQAASVDVAVRRLADGLATGFGKLAGGARYHRLAVLPFGEVGPEAKKRELGALVSAEVATDLRQAHGLLLVERARVGALLGEMKLGEMGLVDPATAPKVGKLADAQALVIGTVADAGDHFLVNARVVATETGETLASASETVPAASLVALSSEAVVLRTKKDAVFRSLLVPGWGQSYNRQGVKSVVFGVAAAGTLGAALAFHLQGAKAQSDYERLVTAGQLGTDPASRAARLRADAEQGFQRRNGFLWAAGAVWAVNVVDAYLFGVDGDKVVDGVAVAPVGEGLGVAVAGRF